MLTFRMWENHLFKNNYQIIKNENPYKDGTFESICVQYVLDNVKTIGRDLRNDNFEIVKILKEHKVHIKLSPWTYYELVWQAIFLARQAGCVAMHADEASTRPKFAVFFESGLINLLKDKNYTNYLAQMEDPERRNMLWQAAYIAHDLSEQLSIPYIEKADANTIKLKNHSAEWFERIQSLPIHSWSNPSPNNDWVKIHSRGIFHHVGDEMAFISAASQYGEVYVVGKDEVGDLIILARYGVYKEYDLHQRVNIKNFDYIYSTPKGESMYPSLRGLEDSDSDDCRLNNHENSKLENGFWTHEVFLKHAARDIQEYTVQEFLDVLRNNQEKALATESAAVYQTVTELLNKTGWYKEFLLNFKKLSEICEDKDALKFLTRKEIKIDLYNFSLWLEQALFAVTTNENYDFPLLTYVCEDIKNNNVFFEDEKMNEEVLPLLQKLVVGVEHIKILNVLNSPEFNEKMQKASRCFYKTIGHKVHCEIINPNSQNDVGFFLKNDGKSVPDKLFINYIDFIKKASHSAVDVGLAYVSQDISYDFKAQYDKYCLAQMNKNAYEGDKYDELLWYWRELDIKALIVSELIDMQNEYRIFMINNRPVATSPCFRNTTPFEAWQKGRFDPRLCIGHSAKETILNKDTRARVALYAKFARQFGREMAKVSPECKNYVLDVAWSDDKKCVVPIEINSITWSGAYQINMNRLCAAIAQVPFNYEDMDRNLYTGFHTLKENARLKMIEDGIIVNESENTSSVSENVESVSDDDYDDDTENLDFNIKLVNEDHVKFDYGNTMQPEDEREL